MEFKIYYHSTSIDIKLLTVIEADFVHTRNLRIESVASSINIKTNKLSTMIYLDKKPSRIDIQNATAIIMDEEFAERHPSPYGIFKNTAVFGKPVTVY